MNTSNNYLNKSQEDIKNESYNYERDSKNMSNRNDSVMEWQSNDRLDIQYNGFTASIPAPSERTRDNIWSTIAGATVALLGVFIGAVLIRRND